MQKGGKKAVPIAPSVVTTKLDPLDCPFREFRDNELSPDYWGMGPQMFRNATNLHIPKATTKPSSSTYPQDWIDDQTQPLPRSVRQFLHGWVKPEEFAMGRWECEVEIFNDEDDEIKISVIDFQLSYTQVLLRSSFCRHVLSACYILERIPDGLPVEHQWENFNFAFGPEGWRPRYHIYSPGMKGGGGSQHRPSLSKNGCYLVRLFYLGAWRCVWVSDQVPVDSNGSPLLPFTPLSSPSPIKGKGMPATVTSAYVYLWPLLLCKALLKIAAPDMSVQLGDLKEDEIMQDELLPEFDLLHTLTGGFSLVYSNRDYDTVWNYLAKEVKVFTWDEEDDLASSTIRSKSTKKTNPKDKENITKKGSLVSILISDTKDCAPYILPGITPAHEMNLLVSMIRDVPIKRPLPEPEVSLWKHYRWIDWARHHGLYEAYECPRTKFLKVSGLMKLSYAPHLLDVQSSESITHGFRQEHSVEKGKKGQKEGPRPSQNMLSNMQVKEDLREWMMYDTIYRIVLKLNIVYYPSMFDYTSVASSPPVRITKTPMRGIDIQAPKAAPLYLQIDSPEEQTLNISMQMLHPRILLNSGIAVEDYIQPAYVILECFEWFIDKELPIAKAFITTRGYNSMDVSFLPGRHYCRLWVHSRMHWHVAFLSESTLLLGTRDVIQVASTRECEWASKFLNYLGAAFSNWIKVPRSLTNILMFDREFYASYQPDLTWDAELIGYDKAFLHWMFRQALQSVLSKRMLQTEYQSVSSVLRQYFCDPDFGFQPKPKPPKSLREIVGKDPCDCVMPEVEAMEEEEKIDAEERERQETEEKPLVSPEIMAKLLTEPEPPVVSQVCELATDELVCGILKDEREKVILQHEAAIVLQAYWRGTWARKCLSEHVPVTPETLKLIMDHAFGTQEALSCLMNEFFQMYPGTNYAYSVASALSGIYGIAQHVGVSPVTPKCVWIPYFQGVFYCHAPVKVHFDVHTTLIEHSTVQIYDNDTGEILPQSYNAHITFDIHPNIFGYTVMGHGSLNQPLGYSVDDHWQLTIHTSIDSVFHVCDNEEVCTVLPLNSASKLHIDEMYIPNRRNILGGIQISVTKVEAVSFRAAATMTNLEIEAVLRTTNQHGEIEEVARCQGKGEIFWPYIRLKPIVSQENLSLKKDSPSAVTITGHVASSSLLTARSAKSSGKGKGKDKDLKPSRSATKTGATGPTGPTGPTVPTGQKAVPVELTTYTIQVIAPDGWPLPIQQWKRINEVRNDIEVPKAEVVVKKPPVVKEKPGKDKDKDKIIKEEKKEEKPALFNVPVPIHGDAYVELECSTTVDGGALAKRDDERDLLFATVRRSWETKEPGRNARGADIRALFREEFLVPIPVAKSYSSVLLIEETLAEESTAEDAAKYGQPGPTPETESGLLEIEPEEEAVYYDMPEILKDKFVPLYYVPDSTREMVQEEGVLVTEDMAEAAKSMRSSRLEAALQRMRALQEHNELHVLGRQKLRYKRLETLWIDSDWCSELDAVLVQRDEAIAQEQLDRIASANKKKLEAKQVTGSKPQGKK